jgi:hypothetical protein
VIAARSEEEEATGGIVVTSSPLPPLHVRSCFYFVQIFCML